MMARLTSPPGKGGTAFLTERTRSVFATSSHLSAKSARPGSEPACPEPTRSNRFLRIDPIPSTLEPALKKSLAKLWYY